MMDNRDEGQQFGAHIGLCHWAHKPRVAAAERILCCGKPHTCERIYRRRLRLTDPERSTLAEIGKRLGRKALKDVACVAKPRHDP